MLYSTAIGIDTHSNKNTICALEVQTGTVREAVFSDDPAEIVRWIGQCRFDEPVMCVAAPGPFRVGKRADSPLPSAVSEALPWRPWADPPNPPGRRSGCGFRG